MIQRRALLGLSPFALFSSRRSDRAYFGRTLPPTTQSLVHTLAGEVETLDPARSTSSSEVCVLPALFEGLTQYHPELPTPMAGLATHYEANTNFTQFCFYLRGHPSPRGVRLPSSSIFRANSQKGGRPRRHPHGPIGAMASRSPLMTLSIRGAGSSIHGPLHHWHFK